MYKFISSLRSSNTSNDDCSDNTVLQHSMPLKRESQVFCPIPPKTVLSNPKLRDWDLLLSERASNMLKNLERTHWVTSYQMHYTGNDLRQLWGWILNFISTKIPIQHCVSLRHVAAVLLSVQMTTKVKVRNRYNDIYFGHYHL